MTPTMMFPPYSHRSSCTFHFLMAQPLDQDNDQHGDAAACCIKTHYLDYPRHLYWIRSRCSRCECPEQNQQRSGFRLLSLDSSLSPMQSYWYWNHRSELMFHSIVARFGRSIVCFHSQCFCCRCGQMVRVQATAWSLKSRSEI